jgi:H+/Cl- antiporter ClcA
LPSFAWSTYVAAGSRYLTRWLALVAPVAVAVGTVVALFLWSLDLVTRLRWAHPWLLWLLPVGGAAVGAVYQRWGQGVAAGTDLIVDEIHAPGGGVPARMTPLVLAGTLATHLFGGSAGREGTAVQMGGSLASTLDRRVYAALAARPRLAWLGLDAADRRVLLQTGVAAGFGAVFGTPLAGAVFAIEVVTGGRRSHAALVPCLLAALLGDRVTTAWGLHHTEYQLLALDALGVGRLEPGMLGRVAVAAVGFGLVSALFAGATHRLADLFRRLVPAPWLRPALGGTLVVALTLLVGTRDYLGLGVVSPDPAGVSILASFRPGGAEPWSWALKLGFTAVTVASGFKGGEVTPLFFMGATLGHTLAAPLEAPVVLFAALGFVAVFAGATNTPLACTIMGVELFGADAAAYLATACFVAYLFSGRRGIYRTQRLGTPITDRARGAARRLRRMVARGPTDAG